jgi:hypothetical protein
VNQKLDHKSFAGMNKRMSMQGCAPSDNVIVFSNETDDDFTLRNGYLRRSEGPV